MSNEMSKAEYSPDAGPEYADQQTADEAKAEAREKLLTLAKNMRAHKETYDHWRDCLAQAEAASDGSAVEANVEEDLAWKTYYKAKTKYNDALDEFHENYGEL